MLPDVLQRAADYLSGLPTSLPAHNLPLMMPLIMGIAVGVPIALVLIAAFVRGRLLR
jgi:hypothetical protein